VRWLIVHPGPNFSVADMHNGWAEALRDLGEDVMEYNLDVRLTAFDHALRADESLPADEDGRRPVRKMFTFDQATELAADGMLGACFRWWPHVVLLVSAFFTPPFTLEVMRSRGMKIVMLFSEAPYQTGQQLEMAKYAHISLVNDPTDLDEYKAASGVAEYMPHAYRPSVHFPAKPGARKAHDLAFVGSAFRSRIDFFEAMRLDGLDVALAGFWSGLAPESPLRRFLVNSADECLDNTKTADFYRRSRTGINFYRREGEAEHHGEGWAIGPREVELAACGTWFARDPRPESDALFPMLPAFSGPEEAGELIRWALKHPGKRAEAAAAARAAIEGRTFTNSA